MKNNDPVLDALGEQVGCYRRLAKLARIQHEHVRQSRMDQLIHVLQRREQVIEQMSHYDRIVAPARQRWNEYLAGLDPDSRAKAESLLSETRSLLEQITSADRDDALVLQQQKLNIGRQINKTASARQINRTYGIAAYGQKPSRMDLRQ